MKLTDYIAEEDLKTLQQELHDTFGLNADVMDGEGARLFGNTWGNVLCKAIREDAKGMGAICVPAGQVFIHEMQQGEPFSEECDAGMMRISVPVVVDGEVIGGIGGCGLMPADGEVDAFTIGMMSDVAEADAEKMAEGVQVASEERVKEIQGYIAKRISELKK